MPKAGPCPVAQPTWCLGSAWRSVFASWRSRRHALFQIVGQRCGQHDCLKVKLTGSAQDFDFAQSVCAALDSEFRSRSNGSPLSSLVERCLRPVSGSIAALPATLSRLGSVPGGSGLHWHQLSRARAHPSRSALGAPGRRKPLVTLALRARCCALDSRSRPTTPSVRPFLLWQRFSGPHSGRGDGVARCAQRGRHVQAARVRACELPCASLREARLLRAMPYLRDGWFKFDAFLARREKTGWRRPIGCASFWGGGASRFAQGSVAKAGS